MSATVQRLQPESQLVKRACSIDFEQDAPVQREIPLLGEFKQPILVPEEIVNSWSTYREAVIWCWANQRNLVGVRDKARQTVFANYAGMHAPHASRCLKPDSKAPMLLQDRFINALEMFTGWRGVRQYQLRDADLTAMEFVIASRRAA